ncbi:hypothetical protein P3T76_000679 [Phytophthora citrophthora]|uniref:RxLR effector protein n=1 Tax=Phytophthora citrophthora TaxID=4793 RepID=A0AAD9H0C4_9STRA|nr:hypothetical protein P3T76_000679 [Phytophthora citrophthora]
MRANAAFTLLFLALIACCNDFTSAKTSVTQHSDTLNAPVNGELVARKLRTTATTDSEERGIFPNSFMQKISGIFNKNPKLVSQVEKIQKNPAAVKNLEKAALTEKSAGKLRSWLKTMNKNTSKMDKFFIIATLILFGVGAFLVWKR